MSQLSQNIFACFLTYEVLTLASAVILGKYLKYEFRSKASLTEQWRWIAAALVLLPIGIAGVWARRGVAADFLMHAISGGIICLCLFYYLVRTFKPAFRNWRLELLTFFMFLSTFGVLNELMEFALDTLGFGHFSAGRLDTWRDLLANSLGGIVLWLILRAGRRA